MEDVKSMLLNNLGYFLLAQNVISCVLSVDHNFSVLSGWDGISVYNQEPTRGKLSVNSVF